MQYRWFRVNKEKPCIVCGRFDWDTYCPELNLACCMRCQSNRPAKNGGWLHPLGDTHKSFAPRVPEPPKPSINAFKMMREFSEKTWPSMKRNLAVSLGVTQQSLEAIGCAWAPGHNAWAFPMKDWSGNIIGIRLRDSQGHKWSVKGSRAGLFYGEGESEMAVIVEGPTDAAAAISIGLKAIGRPSCLGSESEVSRLLRRMKCKSAVIIADNDGPGLTGAKKLRDNLPVPTCIAILPTKDIREFVQAGGTLEVINSIINSLVWHQPTTRTSDTGRML